MNSIIKTQPNPVYSLYLFIYLKEKRKKETEFGSGLECMIKHYYQNKQRKNNGIKR